MTIPITLSQIRAALDPDDYKEHIVTASDAALMCLSRWHDSAKVRLFGWLRQRGWRLTDKAAGNYHFERGAERIWLEENIDVAAEQIVNAIKGEGDLPAYDHVSERDERPGYEILAEISATVGGTVTFAYGIEE